MKNSSSATVKTFIVFILLLKVALASVRQTKLYEFRRKLLQQENPDQLAARAKHPERRIGRVFYPIGYGADPTGVNDSAAAIMSAVSDAVKLRTGKKLLPGISDLGGVVIDLQGGNFAIGTPLRFPPGIGNIVVQGGTLRASSKFPGNRHLVELWSTDSPANSNPDATTTSGDPFSDMKDRNNDGMKYEDITFRDILFDSSDRGGGLQVIDSIRIIVVDCFFLRFTTQGILVVRGHETFISRTFLGQDPTDGGDPNEKNYSGIGIDIASTDNAVTDVVVFSAQVGIVLRGNANIVTGVHCYNKATGFGGIGILIQSAQNRIVSPYLDYNSIVVVDPKQVHISNGFFLGGGNIVLQSSEKARVSGLTIVDNIFSGRDSPAPSVDIKGVFRSIDQVVVDRNVVDSGMELRSTIGRKTVPGNGTKWAVDFSGVLLFPDKINHVLYSFYYKDGDDGGRLRSYGPNGVTNVSNNVVVIESKKRANAVVSVTVDQFNMAGEVKL